MGWSVGWRGRWWGGELVELVEEVAACGVEEVDGFLDEWGCVSASEVVHAAGGAGAEEVGGHLFGK